MVIGGNLVSMEFGGFLRHAVDFGGNLRLINLSGFLSVWVRAKVTCYRVFLFVTGGGK